MESNAKAPLGTFCWSNCSMVVSICRRSDAESVPKYFQRVSKCAPIGTKQCDSDAEWLYWNSALVWCWNLSFQCFPFQILIAIRPCQFPKSKRVIVSIHSKRNLPRFLNMSPKEEERKRMRNQVQIWSSLFWNLVSGCRVGKIERLDSEECKTSLIEFLKSKKVLLKSVQVLSSKFRFKIGTAR